MLLSPSSFESGSAIGPRDYHFQSLPTAWGICQSASWRRVVLLELTDEPTSKRLEPGLELLVGEIGGPAA